MNEHRYIVSYHHPGYIGASKIYKYRKCAFNCVRKFRFMFGKTVEIMVEAQERKDGKWIMKDRWSYD